ncbi:hypothetical protein V495_01372 [Pseudogymnoascus sp. VKM F-4514 (FW-929)]|nr:hypothetical protein V490_09370 [Pseudogymnoascus sp. VKM F-3557]KFY48400.1 hypothetical protein V495_01372 [Pseudogymnoascus sp. VKM F-4514 (FW-929)]KFY66205.1 hypothetical protein V497_01047 [Pseudogymnoascus sp. VKM F-4516 (FW-969)]
MAVRESQAVEGTRCLETVDCKQSYKRGPSTRRLTKSVVLLSILAAVPTALAQDQCVSLAGSKACPAFNSSSVSVTGSVADLFPFLKNVKDTASFDQKLLSHVQTSYVQDKYQNLLGCTNIDLTNTTQLYARFTTSVICNAIIQNSKQDCKLSGEQLEPLCADTCSQQALSEGRIINDANLCTTNGFSPDQQVEQIRADFINCALPANSLNSGNCINGIDNEPDNCGFGKSTVGLCGYCGAGGQNSTDTCCYNSQAESVCAGVVLPTITKSITLPSSSLGATSSSTPSATAPAANAPTTSKKLSGGAIAGIVIGAIVGLALIIALVLFCLRRRRGGSQNGSVFNQPSPPRKGTSMVQAPGSGRSGPQPPAGFEVLPGGRIARMSALEGGHSESPTRGSSIVGGSAAGAAAGYARGRRHGGSSSSEYGESLHSDQRRGVLRPPPAGRRNGSLSSGSALGEDPTSPISGSGNELSSPHGIASQQSEQLAFFKDYYSQDEIHPGDKVSTLWAYQPRAGDEFMLERGDMLKVVGIWDDGWATGVIVDERAEEWDAQRNAQRDSGVSNTGRADPSATVTGEIKAFPLVCVCLPEHWKKTIEGDGSTETNSSAAAHA